MKFLYPGADLSKIIKSFKQDGCLFTIEYFDGEVSSYYCSDPNRAQQIKNKMYNQALERQEIMTKNNNRLGETMILYSQIIFALGLVDNIKNERDFLTFLIALMMVINAYCQVQGVREKIELDKYRMFFELYNSLDEVNKSEFMKCIEFENMYQKQLDIDTVDDFSYSDIRTLYRKLNEQKN